MASEFRIYRPGDRAIVAAVIQHPSLAEDFDVMQGPHAVDAWLADPFHDLTLLELAFEDGAPAGLASVFALNGRDGGFVMMRIAVLDRFRCHGLGSRLLERALAGVARRHPQVAEISTSFWLPNEAAEAFTMKHDLERVRTFWLMERPRGPIGEPAWPPGIRLAGHDGTDRQYRDIAAAYNDSFAHHYHSVQTTIEETHGIFERPGMRLDGLMLAYRGDECVGFCRGELHASRGEIAVLGTIQSARGIGLGRALLRWGVQWLERETPGRVTLLVDGQNESALSLYRSEGFALARSRAVFSRAPS